MKITKVFLKKIILETLEKDDLSDIFSKEDEEIVNKVSDRSSKLKVINVIKAARLRGKSRRFGPGIINVQLEDAIINININLSHLDNLDLGKDKREKLRIQNTLGKYTVSYDINKKLWMVDGKRVEGAEAAKEAAQNLVPRSLSYADPSITNQLILPRNPNDIYDL